MSLDQSRITASTGDPNYATLGKAILSTRRLGKPGCTSSYNQKEPPPLLCNPNAVP